MSIRVTRPKDGGLSSFACHKCGKRHYIPLYVVGHSNDEITHTCDCGAKHLLLHGDVWEKPELPL